MNEYNISLNKEQLKILEEALDLYSRIGSIQLEEMLNILNKYYYNKEWDKHLFDHKDDLKAIKDKFGYALGASMGIGHPNLNINFKTAYDMQKCIQNRLAVDDEHHEYSVWYDRPLKYGNQPLITVKNKGEE